MTGSERAARLPAVAVVLITYNHEKFIAESIRSVLSQDYPGTIHLVVSDDCSTDETAKVISDTIPDAPSNVVVRSVLRDENVGGLRNLSETWVAANQTGSDYIALLEGDDCWTEPRNLALQIGYMEQHPSTTISFGLARELVLGPDAPPTTSIEVVPPDHHPTFGQLLAGNFIQTCTVVYRRGVLPEFPAWFSECSFRDWPLHLVHASAGDINFLDRVVAVHRQHQSSKWWNPTKSQRERVKASVAAQRLAIQHLGAKGSFRRSKVSAGRQLWWASASRNAPERWLHLLAAAVLDPALIARKVTRAASSPR